MLLLPCKTVFSSLLNLNKRLAVFVSANFIKDRRSLVLVKAKEAPIHLEELFIEDYVTGTLPVLVEGFGVRYGPSSEIASSLFLTVTDIERNVDFWLFDLEFFKELLETCREDDESVDCCIPVDLSC
jgi:hypothetical protein